MICLEVGLIELMSVQMNLPEESKRVWQIGQEC